MKEWIKISLILCTFGFFREMRPSEPFVTEFLTGEWRNLTSEQINREVYPVGTYSYLAQLIIVFLVTDILRYKSIIVFSACVGIIIWSLLLWTRTLLGVQFVEALYGTFMAAEVAYYTYIYAKINRDKYQQVTGHTRAAILSGRFLASVIAQVMVSFEILNLLQLNYISLASQCFSLLWALLLPPVRTSVYFYSKSDEAGDVGVNGLKDMKSSTPTMTIESNVNLTKVEDPSRFSCSRASGLLWNHFISSYSNTSVIQWSLWWSLSMAGFIQVQVYVQLLWQEIDGAENLYNGAVEATLTLFGAITAFVAGYIANTTFDKHSLWILTSCSMLQGVFIFYSSITTNVWIAYTMYIVFGILYSFMITMASASVARNLQDDSFGLIFGINTFVALIFQTLLTIAVVSESGLALDTRGQFKVYGVYYMVLASIYLIFAVVTTFVRRPQITAL